MKQFSVSSENEGQRFDKYLHRILGEASMSFIYKMLRKKNFVLNDKKADGHEIIKAGDDIKLYISDDTYDLFKTKSTGDTLINNARKKSSGTDKASNPVAISIAVFNIRENIVYEDKDIILVNKPAGILSQKADINDCSMNEYVIDYLKASGFYDENDVTRYKPSVVNRLDRNTSGIIIAAKTLKAAQAVSKGLKDRSINKYYMCVVAGTFDKNGIHEAYLTKDKKTNTVTVTNKPVSKESEYIKTGYECIGSNGELSLLKVHLITGKSHQIRSQLSNMNFPILGDPKYGSRELNRKYNTYKQCLHAYRTEFPVYKDNDFIFSGKSFECIPDYKDKYKL